MQQIYTPTQNYKVLVHTITYNQAKYITDTLDGVAMQQTNFPFVHYVIDDCSTDGEQEIIKAWINENCDMDKADNIDLELANVILVPHKTNQNLTFAVYLLKRNLWKEPKLKETLVAPWRDHCEYEALCEGDDYWTHPQKLQKQVDLMDANPDVTLCFHNAIFHFEDNANERFVKDRDSDGNPIDYLVKEDMEDRFYDFDDTWDQWYHPTASWLIRRTVLDSDLYKRMMSIPSPNGDDKTRYTCARMGRLYSFAEPMSVYRIQAGGISQNFQGSFSTIFINRHFFFKYLGLEKKYWNQYHKKFGNMIYFALARICSGKGTSGDWESLKTVRQYEGWFLTKCLLKFPFKYLYNQSYPLLLKIYLPIRHLIKG